MWLGIIETEDCQLLPLPSSWLRWTKYASFSTIFFRLLKMQQDNRSHSATDYRQGSRRRRTVQLGWQCLLASISIIVSSVSMSFRECLCFTYIIHRYGRLSDITGRKPILFGSISIFLVRRGVSLLATSDVHQMFTSSSDPRCVARHSR